jgi:WD domain, G-beta repeat
MYVAACAFDKTVNLFDFFSGDLLAQVSGHSELITAVRFSPDGRHLLSVGGDGCIMIWAMAEPFVAAMQERASELLLSSQQRQSKVFASRGADVSSSNSNNDSHTVGLGVRSPSVVPPPPPPDAANKSVVEGVRTDARKGTADSAGETTSSGRGSRWASRVDPKGGYELFGRKMGSASAAQKMKLTLEPSSFADCGILTDDHDGKDGVQDLGQGQGQGQGHSSGVVEKEEISDDKDCHLNDDSVEEDPYEGNQLANTLEESDDVMGFEGSDDGASKPDKSSKKSPSKIQSPPFKEDDYEDDFDAGNDSGSEAFLAKATSKIDTLEQSATHLENWLENMVSLSYNFLQLTFICGKFDK